LRSNSFIDRSSSPFTSSSLLNSVVMEAGQSSCEPDLRNEEEEGGTAAGKNEGVSAARHFKRKDSCCGIETTSSADACESAHAAAASVISNDVKREGNYVPVGCRDNEAKHDSFRDRSERSSHNNNKIAVDSAQEGATGEAPASTKAPVAPTVNVEGTSKEEDQSSDDDPAPDGPPFAVGDHVYRYNSFFSLHQQHGIVLGVYSATAKKTDDSERREDEEGDRIKGIDGLQDGDDEDDWVLLVFDFASWNPKNPHPGNGKTISTSSSSASRSCVRVYESSHKRDKWTKVEYGVSPTSDLGSAVYHHLFGRAGSFTTAQSSPPGWVCARVEFLRLHPDVLPPYNSISSNAECVAVWCKTGTWATLQATSLLSLTAMGQVKSTATIAGVVGTAQVTVPAAGMVRF
jgi:hypothetical protein